jgi:hypothetical protein
MSNEMTTATKKTVLELDGFNAFTNEVEGDDNINTGSSIIQGTKLKYLDPCWWIGEQNVTGTLLTAVNVLNVVTKWGHDKKPLETRILAPGERFPDFAKLNTDCPQSEWRVSFGKEVGPWSGQHCLYLIDEHFNCYTWASPITTAGSAIAVRELVDQIRRVRKYRDRDNVYPVVELSHTHFPNGYKPDRERPHLLIRRWVTLGADRTADVLPPPTTAAPPNSGSAPAASGSAPAATQGAPADAQPVPPVTLKEETKDEIPW